MEPILLDKALEAVDTIDIFDSLIWTDRFSSAGDFEILLTSESPVIGKLDSDYFLIMEESDRAMILEDFVVKSDAREGKSSVLIKGRSLESLLYRRIVWTPTILSGNLQTEVQRLLNENAINPVDPARKINRLIFVPSTDPAITSIITEKQLGGETLYEAVQTLCSYWDIGFKITLTEDNKFAFQLYTGADRSYSQDPNPYVVFSPEYENLKNSEYREITSNMKTVTLVAGEGEGIERTMISVSFENAAGSDLDRREMFTDAENVSRKVEGGTLTEQEYIVQLSEEGAQHLAKNVFERTFEGEADASVMFVYGIDFTMGDIVQIANEYGHEARSRVVEIIFSQDSEGKKIYPTFSDPL